jgi:hypothetical protein
MSWARVIALAGLLLATTPSGCASLGAGAKASPTGTATLEVTASGTMPCSTIHDCTAFFVIRGEDWDGFWRAGPDEHAFATVPIDETSMWSPRRVSGPAEGLPATIAPGRYVLGGAHADISDVPGGGYFNDSVLCTSDLIVEPSATRVEIRIDFTDDLHCTIDIVQGAGRGVAQLRVGGSGSITCAHPYPDICSAFFLIRPASWDGVWTADAWDGAFAMDWPLNPSGAVTGTLTGGFHGPGSIEPGNYILAGVRAEFVGAAELRGSEFVEPAVLCTAPVTVTLETARIAASFAFADRTCQISVATEPFPAPPVTAPSS